MKPLAINPRVRKDVRFEYEAESWNIEADLVGPVLGIDDFRTRNHFHYGQAIGIPFVPVVNTGLNGQRVSEPMAPVKNSIALLFQSINGLERLRLAAERLPPLTRAEIETVKSCLHDNDRVAARAALLGLFSRELGPSETLTDLESLINSVGDAVLKLILMSL